MPAMDDAYGLVIGIANYTTVRPVLPPSVLQDAADIYGLLVDPAHCAYPADNVQLLVDGDATRDAILAALDGLAAKTTEKSTVFFYISCHGFWVADGPGAGGYLVPVDAVYTSTQSLIDTTIAGEEFSRRLAAIPAGKVVVVLDCCHAGGIGAFKDIGAPEMKAGLPDTLYDTLKEGKGRVILASSLNTERSLVLPGDANSLFTRFLLAGLRGGALGTGGVIRILDLFSYVQPQVAAAGPQHPFLKAEVQENFPVALYLGATAATPVPAAAPTDGFAYDVFLSYYPKDPDKTWVRKTLLPQLAAQGLKTCVDYRDFRLGSPVIKEIERAVVTSRYTLAVLSPGYLSSGFNDLEDTLAQHLEAENREVRLITLLRENCTPPLGLRMRFALDLTDPDADEFAAAVDRLAYQFRQPPAAAARV